MPFSQNWTFCRAFSLLDAGRVSTAGAPLYARATHSTVCAGRCAGSGSSMPHSTGLPARTALGRRDVVPHYATGHLGVVLTSASALPAGS